MHRQLNRSIITIVVWNNGINIIGSIVVGQLSIRLFGDALLAVITTALTFGIIVFAEIIPKALGIRYAESIAVYAAPLLLVLTTVMFPVVVALEWLTNIFHRGERKIGTEEQIRSLVTIGRRRGHIESDEGQLIHRAFILNDKRAGDIMTPLKDIVGLEEADTIREAATKVFNHTFSRYPVFGASIHELVGIAMSHDILEALAQGKDTQKINTILREGLVVKSALRSDRLITLFRDKHIHLAIVQSDGHTVGLVTLEDVLEELVGEIEDETDVENE